MGEPKYFPVPDTMSASDPKKKRCYKCLESFLDTEEFFRPLKRKVSDGSTVTVGEYGK